VENSIEKDHPRILSGMLDLLVEAKKYPLNLQNHPFHSDFMRYGAGMAEIMR